MELMIGLIRSSLHLSSPVMLVSLGETFLERVGLLNIGTEGTMLVGAFASVWAMTVMGDTIGSIGAGALAGGLWGFLFALLAVIGRAEQVIVGAGLNFLALGVTGGLLRSLQSEGVTLVTAPLPTYPPLNVNGLGYSVFLLAVVGHWFLFKTRWGIILRGCGEDPETMANLGFRVRAIRFLVALTGSSLMGVGGAALSIGESGTFIEGMTAGQGFVALSMVILGRWNPLLVSVSSWFFGLLRAVALNLQVSLPSVAYQLILILPYLGAIAVLVVAGRKSRAPSALAQPF